MFKYKVKTNRLLSRLTMVGYKSRYIFIDGLAVLIGSGINIIEALYIIRNRTRNKKAMEYESKVIASVKSGRTLAESLKAVPKLFPREYLGLIYVGEESGTLQIVLRQISKDISRKHDTQRKITEAMAYPLIVVTNIILLVIIITVFVTPKLKEIYSDASVELPKLTQTFMWFGNFLTAYWPIIIPVVFLLITVTVLIIKNTVIGRRIFNKISLSTPIVNRIIRKQQVILFCQSAYLMLDNGVPLIPSIEMIAETSNNYYYQKEILRVRQGVINGKSLSEAFYHQKEGIDKTLGAKNPLFPDDVIEIIAVGEHTGRIVNVLNKIVKNYSYDMDRFIDNLSVLLEPILVIMLGIIVGFVSLAVMLPFFSIADIIK